MYRQGDVLLVTCEADRSGETVPPGERGHILAEGEATGHAHTIHADDAVMMRSGTARHLRIVRPTMLRHDEHDPIKVPKGTYRVIIQREYTPEGVRNVED